MQASYFVNKPAHLYVADKGIRSAILNNPFIKNLSGMSNVFVRYMNADNLYYGLFLDIVDFQTKKTKVSMSYTTITDIPLDLSKISEKQFIASIKEPLPNKKGNLLKKILRCKKTHSEDTEYYHFKFLSPRLVRIKLEGNLNENDTELVNYKKPLINLAIKALQEFQNTNIDIMTEILQAKKTKKS